MERETTRALRQGDLRAHAHEVLGHALHFGNNRSLHAQALGEYQAAVALYREAGRWPNLAMCLDALGRALPEAPARLVHAEFATPRSFARYTRRNRGAVGGPPVARRNSNFLAVSPDVLGPGLWVVGDSVFPGQGTMATVMSAIRVVERITGLAWTSMRRAAILQVQGVTYPTDVPYPARSSSCSTR